MPGLRGSEDVLGVLLSAIDSGQAVQFPHRPSRSEPYTMRTVEPWGVVTDNGRWYLVGHDRDRDATRTFRLSRIGADVTPIGPVGAVRRPEDVDLRDIVPTPSETRRPACRPRSGWPTAAPPRCGAPGHRWGPAARGRDGDVIELDIGSTDRLAREIAGYGADAVVLEPASLRDEVLERLRAHAGSARSDDPVSTRLVRLLNMVPYFQANPRVTRAAGRR